MFRLLANLPIRSQILLGFSPVFITLILLSALSAVGVKQLQDQLDTLKQANAQRLDFLEINRNILELQRLALVYSSVGYSGVLHKIQRLEQQISNELQLASDLTAGSELIAERLASMTAAYNEYTQLFRQSVDTQKKLKSTLETDIETLHNAAVSSLVALSEQVSTSNQGALLSSLHAMQLDLLKIYANAKIISTSTHIAAFEDSLGLLRSVQSRVERLTRTGNSTNAGATLEALRLTLAGYNEALRKLLINRSAYLQLINVVLAGKNVQINQLSGELDNLVEVHTNTLRDDIAAKMKKSGQLLYLFAGLAVIAGLTGSIFIANGIANPVKAMTRTLSRLAGGEANIKIPAQQRRDEVGDMAKAANEFKLMAQDLENQTEELEEFAYRTSHDLRSPLVASLSLLDIVDHSISQNQPEQAKQALNFAKDSLTKLEKLVRDILALSRAKNAPEALSDIDLGTLVDDALAKVAHMENAQRLRVTSQISPDIALRSRASRITLIVENLISNAIKYQDLEKSDSYLTIRGQQQGEWITLEIEDNGLGIPSEHRHQMFSMFKRFHPEASFGSGLGLYMVKKSAHIIHAEVEYQPLQQGTLFRLTLPAEPPHQALKAA
ncbi:ATP-binding protein [Spongiibacter taiwanensis]|uniref:sensor histidine kinase n=1 Tax=Spongiibacter taiwanensis TaxID=1748242 RepID=UPI00203515ED|nr:ATP-binding protein [Spongiibacter taiwanensis]USA44583.1 ATP-binding protein [Spongiibacter taiwanensis]